MKNKESTIDHKTPLCKGVVYNTNTKLYHAYIYYNKKKYSLCYSNNIEKAIEVRKEAEKHVQLDFIEWFNNYKLNRKNEPISKETGIYFHKKTETWFPLIYYKSKKYVLGYFKDKNDAISIRKIAESYKNNGTFLEWLNKYKKLKKKIENEQRELDVITFDNLVEAYENTMQYTIKVGSVYTYRENYKRYIQPYFGNVDITSIDVNLCMTWWKMILSTKNRNGQDFKKSTINKSMRNTFIMYLNFALKMGYISSNPALAIPHYKKPNEIPKKLDNFWELSEFNIFISFVDDQLYKDLFYFLFFTGLRIGETLSLTWNDIDFANNKISINKSIRYISPELGYIIGPPKNIRSVRTIDISSHTLDILYNTFENQNKTNAYFNNKWFVFGGKSHLRYGSIRFKFKHYVKISGVKEISLHGLRHSHAAMLINAKVDDFLIAERLGHTVKELYNTYAHIYNVNRKDFYNVLNNIEKELSYKDYHLETTNKLKLN